jgi:hypothetical protein
MEKALAEQLQDVIDALLVAQSMAQLATRTMREQRLYLGLGLNHPDDEIARLISSVQYAKLLAEKKARGAPANEQGPSPAQDVDGRLVNVSDTGDALVVNPVQDATALSGVVQEKAEGLVVVGAEPEVDATPEPITILPANAQPPVVDDAPASQQIAPEEPDDPPLVDHSDIDGV